MSCRRGRAACSNPVARAPHGLAVHECAGPDPCLRGSGQYCGSSTSSDSVGSVGVFPRNPLGSGTFIHRISARRAARNRPAAPFRGPARRDTANADVARLDCTPSQVPKSKREFARGATGTACSRQQSTRRMGDETMNFKFFGTGLAALAFLASSFSAQAADIPRPVYKGGMRPVVAYYNWTGLLRRRQRRLRLRHLELGSVLPGVQHQAQGLPGRRHARLQLSGRLVRLRHRGRLRLVRRQGQRRLRLRVVTCETTNTWLATFRGRIGYAFDRWLPYFTGGGAYGNVKATVNAPAVGVAVSTSSSQLGWTVGGGLEYAFLGNWTRQDRISLRRSRQLRRRRRRRS